MVTDEAPLPSWMRPRFQRGGGDAQLFYKIHGTFPASPSVSRTRHQCAGVPDGCDLQSYKRASTPDVFTFGLHDDLIGRDFRATQPELAAQVERTDQCLILRGVVPDPETLDYFRDAIGLIEALLEAGGIAVFDPQRFKWWSADEWRTRAFEPMRPVPGDHVVILFSEEQDGSGRWYHTRGMRKFGRPDLSVHHVPSGLASAVEDLCNRFIKSQAFGEIIQEGEEIRMHGLPSGWRCRHR